MYLVRGPTAGIIDLSDADAKLIGDDPGDGEGYAVTAGDMDGDGVDDVLVGAPGHSLSATEEGVVYMTFGPVSGNVNLSSADVTLAGPTASDFTGGTLAVGDVDGDGADDVLVCAEASAGIVYVVHGPLSGDLSLSTADATLMGQYAWHAGGAIAVGDADGDGVGDALIGAENREYS